MAVEIERKYLVDTALWQRPEGGVRMRQGYVATKDGTTVRVRIAGDKAFLTLKDHAVGLTRLSMFDFFLKNFRCESRRNSRLSLRLRG